MIERIHTLITNIERRIDGADDLRFYWREYLTASTVNDKQAALSCLIKAAHDLFLMQYKDESTLMCLFRDKVLFSFPLWVVRTLTQEKHVQREITEIQIYEILKCVNACTVRDIEKRAIAIDAKLPNSEYRIRRRSNRRDTSAKMKEMRENAALRKGCCFGRCV